MSESSPLSFYERAFVIREASDGYDIIPQGKSTSTAETYWQRVPFKARIYLEESPKGWGGFNGITLFVRTKPAGRTNYNSGHGYESYENEELFGIPHAIYPTGELAPPEFIESLEFATEKFGYSIDPEVLRAAGIDDERFREILTSNTSIEENLP